MYKSILKAEKANNTTEASPKTRGDRFSTLAVTDVSFNQCSQCKHFKTALRCEAFPNGIPMEIFSGKVNHYKPVKGDNGITFEAK